jgi:hypothetical protein
LLRHFFKKAIKEGLHSIIFGWHEYCIDLGWVSLAGTPLVVAAQLHRGVCRSDPSHRSRPLEVLLATLVAGCRDCERQFTADCGLDPGTFKREKLFLG